MIKWTKAILATAVSFLGCYYWGKFSGFTGFSFAWILNFVLMAWYTFLDNLFNWKYKSSYFDSLAFEKAGAIYKFFGVHLYRKFLVWTGWEKISRKDMKISSKRNSLELAEYKSRSSEAGHSIIFLIVGFVTILVAGNLQEALWLIILNLLLNVYPIMVQRYNRPRYRRLLLKMN
jgi:hypothetical protein